MVGGAFKLFNTGRCGPECAKQPKICLADIWRILLIYSGAMRVLFATVGINYALSLIRG